MKPTNQTQEGVKMVYPIRCDGVLILANTKEDVVKWTAYIIAAGKVPTYETPREV
jgi:hypothetical protein